MPILLFSALGVGWLLLIRPEWLKLNATKTLIALGVLITLASSFTALDQTRITVLVLFAPILVFIGTSIDSVSCTELRKTWKALMIAAVLVPIPLFLAGVLEQNGWQSILYWTANFL
jgi:hypothetical protein